MTETKEDELKLSHRLVADIIMRRNIIKYYLGNFFLYEDKSYKQLKDDWIGQESQRIVNDLKDKYVEVKGDITNRFVDEVGGFIARTNYILDENINNNLIGVNNGILDVENLKIINPTPNIFVPVKIPVTYDSKADCPEFKKFLKEITDNEKDYQCIQEHIGYILWRNFPIHRFLMLGGDGRNGKTTLLNTVKKLFGENNGSSVSIQEFDDDKYSVIELNNKLVNICDDVTQHKMRFTGILKKATGASMLRGQKKYGQPVDFYNTSKLWFSANKLPIVEDDSDAFWLRAMLVMFNKKFVGKNDDLNLPNKLTTPEESSGLLNFAIEGLKRLRLNKEFTYDIYTTKHRWEKYIFTDTTINNFVRGWCDLYVVEKDDYKYITKTHIYLTYELFCYLQNLGAESIHKFNKELEKNSSIYEYRATRKDGDRPESWRGIRLKPEIESFFMTLFEHCKSKTYKEAR